MDKLIVSINRSSDRLLLHKTAFYCKCNDHIIISYILGDLVTRDLNTPLYKMSSVMWYLQIRSFRNSVYLPVWKGPATFAWSRSSIVHTLSETRSPSPLPEIRKRNLVTWNQAIMIPNIWIPDTLVRHDRNI